MTLQTDAKLLIEDTNIDRYINDGVFQIEELSIGDFKTEISTVAIVAGAFLIKIPGKIMDYVVKIQDHKLGDVKAKYDKLSKLYNHAEANKLLQGRLVEELEKNIKDLGGSNRINELMRKLESITGDMIGAFGKASLTDMTFLGDDANKVISKFIQSIDGTDTFGIDSSDEIAKLKHIVKATFTKKMEEPLSKDDRDKLIYLKKQIDIKLDKFTIYAKEATKIKGLSNEHYKALVNLSDTISIEDIANKDKSEAFFNFKKATMEIENKTAIVIASTVFVIITILIISVIIKLLKSKSDDKKVKKDKNEDKGIVRKLMGSIKATKGIIKKHLA